jgi:hypothetical protein
VFATFFRRAMFSWEYDPRGSWSREASFMYRKKIFKFLSADNSAHLLVVSMPIERTRSSWAWSSQSMIDVHPGNVYVSDLGLSYNEKVRLTLLSLPT